MRPRTFRWSPEPPPSGTAPPDPTVPCAPLPVQAVARLDLQRYAGQWHEIARLPNRFQRRCDGKVTATYRVSRGGTLAVHNACRTRRGAMLGADGVAWQPQPADEPAKLKLRFAPAWLDWLPFVRADYWVIALDADYRWAMVGEPRRRYLWILAREARMERALLEELKTKARRMGYDLAPLVVTARPAT